MKSFQLQNYELKGTEGRRWTKLKEAKKIKLCAAEASSEHNMEAHMVTLLGKTVYLLIQESESAS